MTIKVALLATGDELVNGDILNTNGQAIAQQLIDHGITIGSHMVVSDDEAEMAKALEFLLTHHGIVIITGGLGPTSDDRTRYAVSDVIGKPLVFDEPTWEAIAARISHAGFNVHEANRQQALFPEGADIYPNARGSAPGCGIAHKGQHIYLLPGPPYECMPIFKKFVLPEIVKRAGNKALFIKKWRLFGVSEGETAAQLDDAVKGFDCVTGFRTDYPYLEFKIRTHSQEALAEVQQTVQTTVQPFLLSDDHLRASKMLRNAIDDFAGTIIIDDQATGGRLETMLTRPRNRNKLLFTSFTNNNDAQLCIRVTGLAELWQNAEGPCDTTLTLEFFANSLQKTITETFIYRHKKVTFYAVEKAAACILEFLQNH
ncbi:MAG: hypothetical protein CMF50_09890 [Legionellales bacterium]|nr:hypothetical protein [Legionellales bacterium]|tara:strand:- start:13187 stop:14299 length:1113 start_codon:yes stop_codon:yes gene_type:complete